MGIPFASPMITDEDIEAVSLVLRNQAQLTDGPMNELFAEKFKEFLGGDCYCLPVSSCTAALYLAYASLGIGPGDEVIVPAMTHVATVHHLEMLGAIPIFVDSN